MHSQTVAFHESSPRLSLGALFGLFLRVAFASFGGYMAMISAMSQSLVERRRLLSHQDMLDGVSLASVLPGPLAINVVAYVGYRLRGNAGALVAVCAAMAPAFFLMLALSIAYFQSAHGPAVGKIFMGVVPAVAAIILVAAFNMWGKSISRGREGLLAIAAALILLNFGKPFTSLVIIGVAAMLGVYWFNRGARGAYARKAAEPIDVDIDDALVSDSLTGRPPLSRFESNILLVTAGAAPVGLLACFSATALLKLFCIFAGMSLMLFGGAYVFIPLLQHSLVDSYAWLTQREFVDAVAMGQMMPGPVVVVATFIGYKVAGPTGAFVATLGIILPSMLLMLFCSQMLDRVKNSRFVSAALRGVRAAVVGMVFASAILIGKGAAPGLLAWLIGLATLLALLRYRVEAIWIIPFAGLTGLLAY